MAVLVLSGAKVTLAGFNFSNQFSGRIIQEPAFEIQELQALGYQCASFGYTFSIRPIGSHGIPVSYFVPITTISKTGVPLAEGELIIGKYGPQTVINCFNPNVPPYVSSVYLNTVTLFGNSRI